MRSPAAGLFLIVLVASLGLVALLRGDEESEPRAPAGGASSSVGPTAQQEPEVNARGREGRAARPAGEDAESAATRLCDLTVRIETTDGAPLEGVLVETGGEESVEAVTDRAGRASLGPVPRGVALALELCLGQRHDRRTTKSVDVPPDATTHEAAVRVDPPPWAVLVVRIRAEAPRERVLHLDVQRAWTETVLPERNCVRIPIRPPRPSAVRIAAKCPGFLDAEATVEVPPAPGDVPVEIVLRPGGVPAWGRVVEASGEPASGVQVLATHEGPLGARALAETTDADGRFPIEQGMIGARLVALRPAVACSPWFSLDDSTRDVELKLGPGARVDGAVRLDDGAPAPGASVWILFSNELDWRLRWEIASDAQGRYRAGGIPEGWWFRPTVMWGRRLGPARGETGPFSSDAPDDFVRRGEAHVAGGPGDRFVRDLRARRFAGASFSFRLEFPEGAAPPPTVVVETWSDRGHSEGVQDIDPSAPAVTVEMSPKKRVRVFVRAGRLQAASDWLVAEDGADRHDIPLRLSPTLRVVAQLVDATGAAVRREGIRLEFAWWDGESGSGSHAAVTSADGRADATDAILPLALLDDARRALVVSMQGPGVVATDALGQHPNLRIEGPALAARLRAAADEVVLGVPVKEPRTVTIRSLDREGRPVPRVTLAVGPEELLGPTEVTTDEEGRANVQLLREPSECAGSSMTLAAAAPHAGSASLEVSAWETASGEPWEVRVVRLVLQRVRLLDERGTPLWGADLDIEPRPTTDTAGEAEVWLDPDSVGVVEVPGFAPEPVRPSPGGATLEVRLRALRLVTLRFDVPAEAPSDYSVLIRRGGGRVDEERLQLRLSAAGRAHLWLTNELHTLQIVSRDRLWGARAEVPPGVPEVRAALTRLPLRTVRIRCLDRDGAPLVRASVFVRVSDAPWFREREETTDAAGEIRLELPDGRFAVGCRRADRGDWVSRDVDVPAEAPVDFGL